MSGKPIPRVIATPAALNFMAMLREMHGPLMFFQSGGCCDGSAPQCYAVGEFNVSNTDVYLGDLDGAAFYIGADQFEYWKHTQLILDVVDGNGGMFALDNGTGKRFLARSRLFTDDENRLLAEAAKRPSAGSAAAAIRSSGLALDEQARSRAQLKHSQ